LFRILPFGGPAVGPRPGRWLRITSIISSLGLLTGAVTIAGSSPAGAAATNIDFQQCANKNPTLGNCSWINGDLNNTNSRWFEGMSVPQRVLVTGITGGTPGGTHVLTFSHQATKNGVHAYDFLTSWAQASQAHQDFLGVPLTLNECGPSFTASGLDALCATATNSFSVDVPDDPYLSGIPAPGNNPYQTRINQYESVYGNRQITLKGDQPITSATLTLAHATADNGDTGGNGERITYTLTFTSASSTVLVEFAAHLAVSVGLAGWGTGVGAASVPGSSNDVALTMDTFDGQGGLQTNPINSNAIATSVSAINITKIAPGATNQTTFGFTYNPPGDNNTTSFSLGAGQTQPFANLNPGVYVISETSLPTGFDFSSGFCTSGATVFVSGTTVTITLHPNEVVNCTFINTPSGRIAQNEIDITKVVQGVNNGQSFHFTVTPAINLTSSFSLTNGQTQQFTGFPAGTYVVTEPGETGFELIGVDCGPGGVGSVKDGTATITVTGGNDSNGQVVACTFTNRPIARIQITKTVVGNANGQTFNFSFSHNPATGADIAFGLDNGGIGRFNSLPLGTYSVTESGQAGFTLTGINCDAGGAVNVAAGIATITLTAPDQLVNCTFTNTQNVTPAGSITIVKDSQPNSSQDFTFTPSAGLNGGAAFLLDDDGNNTDALPNNRTFQVAPGTFTVSEAATAGFALTSIKCDDADSTGNVATGVATIKVASGEHVTCTFTNVKHGVYGNDPAVNPTEQPYAPNPGGQPAGNTGNAGGVDQPSAGGDPSSGVAGTDVAVSPVADPSAGQGGQGAVQAIDNQGHLPRTGAAIAQQVMAGLLVLAGGLILLALRRRRSPSASN
jgi:LPXTG-motif cell wall-anchored protein